MLYQFVTLQRILEIGINESIIVYILIHETFSLPSKIYTALKWNWNMHKVQLLLRLIGTEYNCEIDLKDIFVFVACLNEIDVLYHV